LLLLLLLRRRDVERVRQNGGGPHNVIYRPFLQQGRVRDRGEGAGYLDHDGSETSISQRQVRVQRGWLAR
jgi:hypothetical protein